METLQLSLSIFLFLLTLLWETRSQLFTRIIRTQSGPIQGITNSFNNRIVDQYLGIPFAQPPVGSLRFRKPYPVKAWTKLLKADKMGPACIQYKKISYPWYDDGFHSEDCLYLNIWVPRSSTSNNGKEKIPVMFWIYGGGFTSGSNKIPLYNGLVFAAEGNVIVVTVNYRLSTLGFFTTGTEEAPGNVAIYDILEALKWINKNIEAFGGDPNQVTLWGQSAGAVVIGQFCVSPLTKGLFKRVIMESGSPAHFSTEHIGININKSQIIAEKVGCADQVTTVYNDPDKVINCMRGKSALTLIEPVDSFPSAISQSIFPNYGDDFLPINSRTALISGQFHNVDVLIGNTHDEGSTKVALSNTTLFGPYGKKNPTISKRHGIALMKDYFKNIFFRDPIIQYYLGSLTDQDYNKVREQIYTAVGDFSLLCPTRYFAEIYSRFGNSVYYYHFVHRTSSSPWAEWMKVVHSEELEYVFGKPLSNPNKYSPGEVTLSSRVIQIWSNFAKYGSPECPDQSNYPESNWPLYSREMPVYVTLGAETKKGSKGYGLGPHMKNCDFYRPYFGYQ